MINSKEILDVARSRLTETDQIVIVKVLAYVEAALRDAAQKPEYDGTAPFTLDLRLDDLPTTANPARCMYAVRRHLQAAAFDATVTPTETGCVLVIDPRTEPPVPEKVADKGARAATIVQQVVALPQRPVLDQLRDELLRVQTSGVAVRPVPPNPVLSVIFGTYNRFDLLQKAVASVRTSAGDLSYEIVVCDGGSTDGSREWLAAQPDVILVGERHLEGAVKAFNQAFSVCRGEFVANMNDDAEYIGSALKDGVEYLRQHEKCGQVAFSFRGDGEDWHINDVYESAQFPTVTWPTTYANFGIIRKSIADTVAAITGGFWSPVYKTYAADCELSAWVWRLGHSVDKLPNLRVVDVRNADALRDKNNKNSGIEAKRMYARWPADAFRPGGTAPRVSSEELDRFRRAKEGTLITKPAARDDLAVTAEMVGFPEPDEERRLVKIARRIVPLDPVEGKFPWRADKLRNERVLHVHLGTDVDPQAGLVRALQQVGSGSGCYAQVRWMDFPHRERQEKILSEAARIKPTLVFMQLQTDGAVDVETVRKLRELSSPQVVITTWCGDVAGENSAWDVDWQVPLGRVVDLVLHSSMSHVRALRAAGVTNAAYLQIGLDCVGGQYVPDTSKEKIYDVSFLGSRYGGSDAFSSSVKWHDGALRDEVVSLFVDACGSRFGLFGNGWGEGVKNVSLDKAHEVYQQSEIGLNVSLMNDLDCYSSDRLLRILGCGALLLTKRFPMMSIFGLVHGKNCLVWDTPEEAVKMAGSYIACRYTPGSEIDGQPPQALAEAGAALARENHDWSIRALEMQCLIDAVRKA